MKPPISREHFALAPELIYLNHAAIGVLPIAARDAALRLISGHARYGVLGLVAYENALLQSRARLARFVGASANEVAFLSNTSHAANILARAITWNPGDEIIINDNEFGSNALPWLALREQGVIIRMIATAHERMTPDVLLRMVNKRTRLVATSWVSFIDGYRHDLSALAEVAHSVNAYFVVDVIQGLGAFPCEMHRWGVDALFGGSQKWLLGQPGLGFLCLKDALLDAFRLRLPGWRSVEDIWNFLDYDQPLNSSVARFEAGTPNLIGIEVLVNALDVLDTASAQARADHILALTDYLVEALQKKHAQIFSLRGEQISSGIVTFRYPDVDPLLLGQRLAEAGIVITARTNGIRVSPHAYSSFEDIDRFIEVM